jgi:uncharacterized protein
VEMTLESGGGSEFTVFLRKPAWAQSGTLPKEDKNGYIAMKRVWKPGDRIALDFSITERLTVSNPRVRENLGKVAVERGPLVYAMEGIDQPAGASLFDWSLDRKARFTSEWAPAMLGGIVVLRHAATRPAVDAASQPLYQTLAPSPGTVSGTVTLIPYYTFHNREITPMQVWIPVR